MGCFTVLQRAGSASMNWMQLLQVVCGILAGFSYLTLVWVLLLDSLRSITLPPVEEFVGLKA
jgi:hypothetical protein